MSAGLEEAASRLGVGYDVRLAVDNDPEAIRLFTRNVSHTLAHAVGVETLFDGDLNAAPTITERRLRGELGPIDCLIGGPPCQGHSNLNNHTRRTDPKNALYLRMARAAEVLKPAVIIIENVPAVQWDSGGVVAVTRDLLVGLGYEVATATIDLARVGIPQSRRRFVMLASKRGALDPLAVLDGLEDRMGAHPDRDVRWAIGDLLDVTSSTIFDSPSRTTPRNQDRIKYLFEHGAFDLPNAQRPACHRDGNHSYKSVYGRLAWNKPAQTITTGFGCMGQGRFVHPQRRRTLTPHEAARLQTFPDWFQFGEDLGRGAISKAIGNAVPPLFMVALGEAVIPMMLSGLQRAGGSLKGL